MFLMRSLVRGLTNLKFTTNMARWQSGYATACKADQGRFDSDSGLQDVLVAERDLRWSTKMKDNRRTFQEHVTKMYWTSCKVDGIVVLSTGDTEQWSTGVKVAQAPD